MPPSFKKTKLREKQLSVVHFVKMKDQTYCMYVLGLCWQLMRLRYRLLIEECKICVTPFVC